MTIWKQDHEAGTSGSSVATGSGGAGNTGTAVIGTAPIITTTAGEILSGTKSAKSQAAAGAASAENMPITAGTDIGVRFLFRVTADLLASTVDETIHTIRGGGGTRVSMLIRAADRKISIADSTGAWVSPAAIVAGDYVIDEAWSTGTTATAPYDGKGKWKITKLSDGSYAAGMTAVVEQTSRNVGVGASFTNVYVGAVSTTGTPARTPIWDDIQTQDSYAFIASANTPPVVTAGGTQTVSAGTTVNLSFGVTDNATIASVTGAISPAGSGATLSVASITPGTATATYAPTVNFPTPGVYTITATATDGSGLTGTGSTIVNATGAAVGMDSISGNPGGWISFGTAGDILISVNDTDATTGISATSGAGATATFRAKPLGPGSAVTLTYSADAAAPTPSTSLTVSVMQGATVVSTRTDVLTTTTIPYVLNVDSTKITDRNALDIVISYT